MTRDLEGMRAVITGANTGIGRATAIELAKRGAAVTIASRSEDKTRPVIDEITRAGGRADFVALELADLASVRRCADVLRTRDEPIDVLVDNAGLAGQRGLTAQGFELTFGVNHLGHFLLSTALLPLIERASVRRAPARIVVVSSVGHYRAKGIDWDALRRPAATVTGLPEYQVSKLCNVLFAKELARRLGEGRVHTYALHPGVIASDVWRSVPWPIRPLITRFMRSTDEGAETSLHCATSPECASHTGRYYDACREKEPSARSNDAALARELWARSETWVADFAR
ncbi:SDR family oxidoreductase [Sandaracinus amylolyticus]|uniref:Putative oxidoreductase/Short-chain dehydrogenase n=1 Tax=Sandaracinus amylolyticus TaxID=927083 RepID=A0A0F6YFV1_9BACT|nr:SDR family oxidoreductase [Sandaracinus amylolyticus]AKF04063.1 putative oxidoreductase/Short-chain dehydrogenase [Sandaracinus amylolyticus]